MAAAPPQPADDGSPFQTKVHAPTFRLFDTTYGADPMACDLVFVSAGLAAHVRRIDIDPQTRVGPPVGVRRTGC